jgi:hypothetical protein
MGGTHRICVKSIEDISRRTVREETVWEGGNVRIDRKELECGTA